MKIVLLVLVVAVICVVLFVTGVISPRRSREMQHTTDRLAGKGEAKGERKAGKLGDLARDALTRSRKAMDRSAEKGRQVHDRTVDKDRS